MIFLTLLASKKMCIIIIKIFNEKVCYLKSEIFFTFLYIIVFYYILFFTVFLLFEAVMINSLYFVLKKLNYFKGRSKQNMCVKQKHALF